MADAATGQPTEAVKPTETSTAGGTADQPTEQRPTNGTGDNKATEDKSDTPSKDDDGAEPDECGCDRSTDRNEKRHRSNDRYERRHRSTDRYENRDRNDNGDRRGGGRGGGRGGRGGGRGRGRGDYNTDRRKNVKTRYTRQEESSDAQEIRRQVEFYFSDSNLPIDEYLLGETGGPENKPFPLKNIHSFKRMRHFQPYSAIVEAVKGSDFLVVNDKDEVFRKEPLDSKFTLSVEKNQEILTTKSMKSSIYAKGFGDEGSTTAFDIEDFFRPYGVKSVRLRRQDDGTFKGSVFVEFVDEDTAKQFLELEEKPKYEGNELKIMSKQAYVDMKAKDILEGKVLPRSPIRKGSSHRNDHNGSYKKRKRNYNDDDDDTGEDWRDRRDKFQKSRRGRGRYRSRSASGTPKRSRSRSPHRVLTEKPADEKKDAGDEEPADAAHAEPADAVHAEPADATEGATAETEAGV